MNDINHIRNQIVTFYKKKKEKRNKEYNPYNNKWYKYYHSTQWQELRSNYFVTHPCCEVCDRQGVVTPTEEVHHLYPYGQGTTEEQKWRLLLSPQNLCATCKHHHLLFHRYMRERGLSQASIDDIIKYEQELEDRIKQYE